MNYEIISIETARKLAEYEKLKNRKYLHKNIYKKSKSSTNEVGVIEANDGRRLKYRTIWRENGMQKSKGFEYIEDAIKYRKHVEKEKYGYIRNN